MFLSKVLSSRFLFGLNRYVCLTTALLCIATTSHASVEPIEENFVMGMNVQGKRFNLYKDCIEGDVSCDNMLLVASPFNISNNTIDTTMRLTEPPGPVSIYTAKTKHSLCRDNITPCGFQGYSFKGENLSGFIDPYNQTLYFKSNWSRDQGMVSYIETDKYLPLISQSKFIDETYKASNIDLNSSYSTAKYEVLRLYGEDFYKDLKHEQLQWILQRSKNCGASVSHEPRTQSEKVCFIQHNEDRLPDFFLWID